MVMDIMMPGLDGFETAGKTIRKLSGCANIVVVNGSKY